MWDPATGAELCRLVHSAPWLFRGVLCVAFSPDGTRIATGGPDPWARIWDLSTSAELLWFDHKRGRFRRTDEKCVSSVAFSPDGSRLLTAFGRTAFLWDVVTGEILLRVVHDGTFVTRITSVAFSPDGTRLVTAGDDNTARVHHARTGEEVVRMAHDRCTSLKSVVFSPDGNWIATGGTDHTARLWDAETGEELLVVPHEYSVRSLAFGPEASQLAMGTWDAVEVWDVVIGKRRLRLNHEPDLFSSTKVAYSPDGARIATANGTAGVVWEL